ncbi:MAG TPA: class I SAM-dependent methyltransferase [Vicinamibacterales bacterium]|nr:class I SAM-dependent methyltransferase [Vicinamibacterales bacterium]
MSDPSTGPATGSVLLNRLLAERAEAHRRYNDALTLLDRAIQSAPDLPQPPASYDETLLPKINDTWSIVSKDNPPRPKGWGTRIFDMVWPAIAPLFEQQMAFNAAVVEHLNRNAAAHRDAHVALERALPALRQGFDALERFESLLVQFLQTITPLSDTHYREIADAITQLRSITDVAQKTAMLAKREVERHATATSATNATTATGATPVAHLAAADFQYVGFEDRFRGSEDAIRARLADYVSYFDGQSNVLDVGCGRGEFLDLLREKGISAKGLDLNAEMIEVCKSRGLDAIAADARSYLQGIPDESLGGLIAVQVVEHLEPAYLTQLLGLAYDKVRPGGRIVLETINPTCWVAFFESFIRDLSHVKPIHPDTLQYLLQANGFSNVEIVYRAPIAPEGRLQKVTARPERFGDTAPDALTELVTSFNRNVDRLNDRMFSYQDFAAIATKP